MPFRRLNEVIEDVVDTVIKAKEIKQEFFSFAEHYIKSKLMKSKKSDFIKII